MVQGGFGSARHSSPTPLGTCRHVSNRAATPVVAQGERSIRLAPTLLLPIRVMRGIITGRDVVNNLSLIYREFGPRCLARLLWVLVVGKRTTFLDVISQH